METNVIDIKVVAKDLATSVIKNVNKEVNSLSTSIRKNAVNAFNEFTNQVRNLGLVFGTVSAGVAGFGINIASELETARQGFIGIGLSAEETDATIERLKQEAKATPFELPGLTKATQLLTNVTKNGDQSIDILLDVGKSLAAVGKGQAELDRIIVNLQQISATGKASALDIKQFAFAGIPIYELLEEATGKAGEALMEYAEDGGVTFELLTNAFKEAGAEGGRFANAFTAQAGTFNQLFSNMKDSLGIFLSDLVQSTGIFDGVKSAIQIFTDFLEQNADQIKQFFSDVFNIIKEVANSVIPPIQTLIENIINIGQQLFPTKESFSDFAKVAGILTGAVVGLTMAIGLLTSPVTIVTTAIVGLAFIISQGARAFQMFKEDVENAVRSVENTVTSILNAIAKFIQNVLDSIIKTVGTFGGLFVKAFNLPLNAIKTLFESTFGGILKFIGRFVEKALNLISPLIDTVKSVGNSINNLLGSGGGSSPLQFATDFINRNGGGALQSPASGAVGGVGQNQLSMFQKIQFNTNQLLGSTVNKIEDTLGMDLQAIKSSLDTNLGTIDSTLGNIDSGVGGVEDAVGGAGRGIEQKIDETDPIPTLKEALDAQLAELFNSEKMLEMAVEEQQRDISNIVQSLRDQLKEAIAVNQATGLRGREVEVLQKTLEAIANQDTQALISTLRRVGIAQGFTGAIGEQISAFLDTTQGTSFGANLSTRQANMNIREGNFSQEDARLLGLNQNDADRLAEEFRRQREDFKKFSEQSRQRNLGIEVKQVVVRAEDPIQFSKKLEKESTKKMSRLNRRFMGKIA